MADSSRNKEKRAQHGSAMPVMEQAGVVLGPQPKPSEAFGATGVAFEGDAESAQAAVDPKRAALLRAARLDRARHGSAGYSTGGEGLVALLLALGVAVALWVGAGLAGSQAREQGALTLRQSVLDSAMQCFAIEGAYPQTLQYLEDEYGLAIDHEEYTVLYEAFASNVPPTVTVVSR